MTTVPSLSGRRLYLDVNVFIYAMEDLAPLATVAVDVLKLLDSGAASAATSELSLAECLVKPIRVDNASLVRVYLQTFGSGPHLTVVPITRDILIAAARLRAVSSLKLPDAIHLATAALAHCDCVITNDARFVTATQTPEVILLNELSV
jgi:predicted nucleic acid-binding protein